MIGSVANPMGKEPDPPAEGDGLRRGQARMHDPSTIGRAKPKAGAGTLVCPREPVDRSVGGAGEKT